ncbi:hypothetical protein [Aliiroseovarius sediminis]|uniref:hypothetical protein n=1 Tax=Aliiroseovarius sediminis TaxID=2925839 RepID=UPI001F577BD5|nr:hypothetical protein [Aliiroseovarius sediminis]MCI2395985.1 hypothetical protein [Aliiroseovarius sediminis]
MAWVNCQRKLECNSDAQDDAPGNRPDTDDFGATASVMEPLGSTVPKLTADHAAFGKLKGPFKTGSDVIKACLNCHT